jgi:serine/threonine protein kinase
MLKQKLLSRNRCYNVSLTNELARSGEGVIWETNVGLLAKIYHKPDKQKESKLEFMINCQPDNPTSIHSHKSLAWPLDILEDSSGKFFGFLMDKITGNPLSLAYMPKDRSQSLPGLTWEYLHKIASNLASSVHAVHSKGYVIGDLKPENILFDNRALVSIIDVDSFQVSDKSRVYRCGVGSREFTPPELIGIGDLNQVDRNIYHDLFGLAVIFYKLLFSAHPYSGIWHSNKPEIQDLDERIKQGYWPHSLFSQIVRAPQSIPIEIAHPGLVSLFKRCFNDGHKNPKYRPTSMEWKKAFDVALQDLYSCKIPTHKYSKTYGKCYWCEIEKRYAKDIYFPYKPVIPLYNTKIQSSTLFQSPTVVNPLPTNFRPIIATKTTNNSPKIDPKPYLYLIAGIVLLGTTVNFIQSFRPLTSSNVPVLVQPTDYSKPQEIPKQKNTGSKKQKPNKQSLPKKSPDKIPKPDQLSENKNPRKPKILDDKKILDTKSIKPHKPTVNTSPPNIGNNQQHTNSNKSMKKKTSDKPLQVKSNLSNTSFHFPMNTCGDLGNPQVGRWYRVLVNPKSFTLEQIKSRYCSDAFPTSNDNTKSKYIQVASFKDEKKAKDLVNILHKELGNIDIRISLN